MKVGIIGGGSVGLLSGSYLANDHEVTVYVRRAEQKTMINDYGLVLDQCSESIRVNALLVNEMVSEDLLIVCVKQQHIDNILPIIQQTNYHTPVIFLQNGMGHIDKLHRTGQPIMVGTVEHGALRRDNITVQHTGEGIIRLAALYTSDSPLRELTSKLNQPAFPFVFSADWKQMLHEKLLINTVINPLTALFDVANGQLLENSYLQQLASVLCREAATALNMDFNAAWDSVQQVIRNTKKNVSSMLKDIREDRGTEIDSITGYLMQISTNPIPNTEFIYRSIKAIETKKGLYP
ncbi:2-dehydropantoate 2-reductase [Virgibacillus siamensis]|uniref:2-dehydropantoate 2-reductase n=1 Tax=Virgibacillus siamensis TaxID=480071 RepID=A0ABN1GK10_9BACI